MAQTEPTHQAAPKTTLSIGELAELTKLSADTLRYYEKIKLLKADARSKAGYRIYSQDSLRVVRFIQGAKALNFTLEEIRELLALNTSNQTTCAEILKQTERKIIEAEAKIVELQEIKKVLKKLVTQCPGDDTSISDCPILDHLSGKVGSCCD